MKNLNNLTTKTVTGIYALSNWGGIEIIGDIEYTPDADYVYWRYNFGTPQKIRKAKIYCNLSGRCYFRTPNGRIHFDQIMGA